KAATTKSLQLLPPSHPLHPSSEKQLQQCEQLLALDQKLAAIQQGQAQPASALEHLALADLCKNYKQQYAAAVRFSTAAFAASPQLADDLKASPRYHAACAAALAAAGKGADAAKLDDTERTRLRKQALDWLRADLAARSKQLEGGNPANRTEVRRQLM